MTPKISIVVPLLNEEGSVEQLHRQIVAACAQMPHSWEIIFVDDGSTDQTATIAASLSPLTLIQFRKNFGQTAAFDAGFKQARGEIVVTLDGDLQNDPADIPLLLAKMEEGYDVVSGWRHKRKDPLTKKISSRSANLLRKVLLRDSIQDSGCSLKAYRAEAVKSLDLYGEMHRFIPALLEVDGWRVGEVKVSHHPRTSGVTKYNWKRGVKSFVDMVFIWFWRKYASRPAHLFGAGGIVSIVSGGGILAWMLAIKLFYGASLSDRIWPLIGVFLVMLGVQFFIFGLIADIVIRNFYKSHGRMNYTIRSVTEKK